MVSTWAKGCVDHSPRLAPALRLAPAGAGPYGSAPFYRPTKLTPQYHSIAIEAARAY